MSSKAKILIVDDDPGIRQAIELILKATGYDVLTASNGLDALQKVGDSHPDLILMDVVMPVLDGLQTGNLLKEDEATRDIPIIMLTGQGRDNIRIDGWKSEIDCYLHKPFDPAELLRFVERSLNACRASAGAGSHELS